MSVVIYEVKDLVKTYGPHRAVDGISFSAYAGQCLGLLGPNGAGKSTTIEVMEGISTPTAGTVRYRSRPLDEDFRQSVGVMFQSTALPDFIRVGEVLQMFSRLYHRSCDIDKLIKRCGISDFLNQPTHKLSGGQRQRLLLAIALINDPEIIFLDEPTTGLDPSARHNLWQIIAEAKNDGKTIILTTHYMEEAHMLCDSIVLMNRGKIVAQGSPRQLLDEQFSTSVLVLPVHAAVDTKALTEAATGYTQLTINSDGHELHLECPDINVGLRFLVEQSLDLNELQIRKKSLDDLFFKLTDH